MSVAIMRLSHADLLNLFRIQLVCCVITLDAEGADDPETDDARLTLRDMRKLHITFLELYGWVWSHLNLPSLVDLKIATFRDTTLWEDDVFEEFIIRSACNLTHLALCFGFLDAIDAMVRILDAAPDLEELTLCWTRLPKDTDDEWPVGPLMDYLTADTGTSASLPSLRKMKVDTTPESVRMLLSRCHGPDSALKEVVLCAEQPSSCEALFAVEIGAMREAGVSVMCETIVFPLEEIYNPNYEGADTPPSSATSGPDDADVYPLTYIPTQEGEEREIVDA
jgi:hypothetical protein